MNLSTKEKEEKKYQHKLLELAQEISTGKLRGSYCYDPWRKSKQHRFYVLALKYEIPYFIPFIETDSAKYCYAFVTEELKKRGIYL